MTANQAKVDGCGFSVVDIFCSFMKLVRKI